MFGLLFLIFLYIVYLNCRLIQNISTFIDSQKVEATNEDINFTEQKDASSTAPGRIIYCFIYVVIIYMKKFLDSDWLKGVQFYRNTVPKRNTWHAQKML